MGLRNLKRTINKKKVVAAASLCALATSALVAGAFFTDKETETVRATAGTVDIELTDSSAIDKDGDGILNPGDTGTLSYNINNLGSKSVDVKTVIEIASDNVLNQDDSEYTLAGDLITEAPSFSEDGKKITYTTDSVILNGTIEQETGAAGTNTDQDYTFTFDIDAKNKFQDDNVKITYTVYAKQHRNTEDSDWAELINKVVSPGGDEDEPEVTESVEINETNFPDETIRNDANGFDVDSDGFLSTDERQPSYTPSGNVTNGFTGADHISDSLVVDNQETTDVVIDGAEHIKDIDASNQGLTSIDVSEVKDLETIDVSGNDALTSIDLSQNTNIKDVVAGPDTNITEVKLPENAVAEDVLKDFVDNGYQVSGDGTVTIEKQDPVESYIPIDEEHFPDANFRQYIADNFDDENDLKLYKTEIDNITFLDANCSDISDLTGIQYFTNLEFLNVNGNNLTEIDLSKNTKLTDLDVSENNLSKIDLSNNTKLTDLNVGSNGLTSIDLSKNTELTHINIQDNQLNSIGLNNNLALTDLNVSGNNLTEIDLSKNTELTYVHVDNNQLKSIDLQNNTLLTYLGISGNNLTEINLNKNTELTDIRVSKNKLNSIDLSNNTKLTNLCVDGNNSLSSLNITNNSLLTELMLDDTQITEIDLSNCNQFKEIKGNGTPTILKVTVPNNNQQYTYQNFRFASYKTETGDYKLSTDTFMANGQTITMIAE